MKKRIVVILLIFCSNILYGYQAEDIYLSNWKTYTNTTYIHQIFCKGDSVIAATWGGISIFNKKDLTFSTLVRSDGLSKNEIRSVHYIPLIDEFWFGTFLEGISRYKDGEFLKPYQENQGVEGDYINDIDDNNGFVFAGTDKGLIMFEIVDDETQFKKTFIAPRWLSDDNVNCITFDDSNRIWIGTNQGIDFTRASYNEMILSENWHHINNNTTGYPFAEEKITCIDYYDNKIYFGTEDGFAVISEIYSGSLEFNEFTYNLPTRKISSILATDDSTVWVGFGKWNETNQRYDSAKGVGRYNLLNPDDYKVWDEDDSLFNQISDIKLDEDGNVWLGTWEEGLYRYKDEDWEQYKKNCISSNIIAVMMFDNNNDLWCGFSRLNLSPASKKGVSKFDGFQWVNYNKNNSGIGNNVVYSLCEDKSGNIWFGHWGGGVAISIVDSAENVWKNHTQSDTDWILSSSISLLECDGEGNVWIGGYAASPGPGGVTIWKPDSTYLQFTQPILINQKADMLTMLLQEEKVWLGCYYTGIQYWDAPGFPQTGGAHWHSFSTNFLDGSCFDFDIQKTDYGNYIFAGCIDGLYMYDEDWDDWYKFTCGLTENVRQYYWNGTSWQPWIYYWYDEQGNPESRMGSGKTNQVNAVFVDPHGRKWIATNGGGISVLDADSYYFTNFNTENSDLCSDVVLSFAYNSYSGELFVGTTEGLCSFNIGASHKDTTQSHIVEKVNVFPDPFITSIHNKIYFESYPNKELPPGNNLLYIYNLAGELITIIKESDRFRFCWDGKNQDNKPVASGIYFYVLSSEFDDVHISGKFAVIR